jgi:hypothetical protein
MSKLLGTPYERGNSTVVISRRPTSDTAIEEGLFVKQAVEGFVSKVNAGGTGVALPFGVMGQQEAVSCAVVTSGLKVAVQLDDSITPTAGQSVYVSPLTNKATNVSNSGANYLTAGTFTGANGIDGRSENLTEKATTLKWAEINMPNGL